MANNNIILVAGLAVIAAVVYFITQKPGELLNNAIQQQNIVDNAENDAIPSTYYSNYMGGLVNFEDFGNSWTTESIKTGTVETKLGTLDTLLSGRGWTDDEDGQAIPGQVAYYNPNTGNAWGGVTGTMDFLYNSMSPEAVAWRLRYG